MTMLEKLQEILDLAKEGQTDFKNAQSKMLVVALKLLEIGTSTEADKKITPEENALFGEISEIVDSFAK